MSFNFMAAVTVHSDFGAQESEVCHYIQCFPIYLPCSDGTRCHDLSFFFLMLSFKPAFSLSSFTLNFPCGSASKESPCNSGDQRLIPGLGRSPGEGKGYPLRYSGLENSMDCIVQGVIKSQTRLREFHFTSFTFRGSLVLLRFWP